MTNTLQLAARKNLIQMSSVTVIRDFAGTYQQLALIILFFQTCSKTDLAQFPN
jgi:hypothetical protein